MRVIHDLGRSISVGNDSVGGDPIELLCYDYRCEAATAESPRPFIHPLRSLAGDVVTGFRPTDHPWHHGLSMTVAVLSEGNFWGGPSYVHSEGYRMRQNHGRMVHNEPPRPYLHRDACGFDGSLTWIGPDEAVWMNEERNVSVPAIPRNATFYDLQFRIGLTNRRKTPLRFGSPTTEGRPAAGYGGLIWRGPRCFAGGVVRTAEREGDEASMGTRSPWLAFIGQHDGSMNHTTLVFTDSPGNPRYPTQWFVRSSPVPMVSFAFMFNTIFELESDGRLDLEYRITVANGALSTAEIVDIASRAW